MKRTFLLALALLALGTAPALHAADEEAGFKNLFNGKDLTGWDGDPNLWSVQDGMIVGQTTRENPLRRNSFLIWKDGQPSNFELRFSYRLVGGNSGMQFRSIDRGNWVVHGYQADFEAGRNHTGILYEEGGRGILARRGEAVWIHPDGERRVIGSVGDAAEIQSLIRHEDWNDYVVIARGNHITQIINRRVTVMVIDDESEKAATSGVLALQLHTGPAMLLQVRDIRLRELHQPMEPPL